MIHVHQIPATLLQAEGKEKLWRSGPAAPDHGGRREVGQSRRRHPSPIHTLD